MSLCDCFIYKLKYESVQLYGLCLHRSCLTLFVYLRIRRWHSWYIHWIVHNSSYFNLYWWRLERQGCFHRIMEFRWDNSQSFPTNRGFIIDWNDSWIWSYIHFLHHRCHFDHQRWNYQTQNLREAYWKRHQKTQDRLWSEWWIGQQYH